MEIFFMALVNLVEIAVYPFGLFYPTYMIECAIVLNVMFLFSLVHSWICWYEAAGKPQYIDLARILMHYIEFTALVDQTWRHFNSPTIHYPWYIFAMPVIITIMNSAQLLFLIYFDCRCYHRRNYKKLPKETAV